VCGITGLLIKREDLRSSLGAMMTPMFVCMAARGSDSGGMAVFDQPVVTSHRRWSLLAADHQYDWSNLLDSLRREFGADSDGSAMEAVANHGVLSTSIEPARFKPWLADTHPMVHLVSVGRCMSIYKDMGEPEEIADRYEFERMTGSHCVGHTRMATESDVTPVHSHPFSAGEDFCLVHNGSLSNPYMLRRLLETQGLAFETDNDTEAACRFIEWRLRCGDSLEDALGECFERLDGFYTLLMATSDKFTLVRDAFACKPAVVAETDDYVAISSEYRSLTHLPGVSNANLFEPHPEEIYSWQVNMPAPN